MNGPQTYNDARIDEICRSVYFNAMSELDRMLKENDLQNRAERMQALAAVASAAWDGVVEQTESEYE